MSALTRVRFHRYVRSPFSGAGNCHCGRAVESTLHSHKFSPRLGFPTLCVCGKPRRSKPHRWWTRLVTRLDPRNAEYESAIAGLHTEATED